MSDALTPILQQLAVQGSVFSRAELRAPWGVRTRGTASAIFHVVVRGAGFARPEAAPGEPLAAPLAFRAGDLLLFPHGHGHVLSDQPETPAAPIRTLARAPAADGLACIATDGLGAGTSLLCGTLAFDAWAADMLIPHLPPLLHVPADHGPMAAWLDATLRMLGAEVDGGLPGGPAVIGRLAELIFIQAVRAWAARDAVPGWLSAMRDPAIGRALAAMHTAPADGWTVDRLARSAGMSRSAFAARFSEQVGVAPAAHLTRWRMLLARRALATSTDGLAQVAAGVGYASEAAFIRAFKRELGTTPAAWRRARAA
ncbi:MAG: AraC family transcriptional regulator [Alphaproteobacteria bacterium]|nr:AraC family transcriptional regulator [Alphaproteobacteria bacterium]